MLEIRRKSNEEISKKDIFMMTKNQNISSMKSLENGTRIPVKYWVLFTDLNRSTGEDVEILSIMAEDGQVIATNSNPFKDMFFDIVEILEETEGFTIEKIGGKTKAGRDFVTCALV